MSAMKLNLSALGLLLVAACSENAAPPPTGNEAAAPTQVEVLPDDSATATATNEVAPETAAPGEWIGRWTGPEGLFLDVKPGTTAGTYALIVKGDLDSDGDPFTGRMEGDMIRFTRNGVEETIRRTDGDATGLKWLAGKTDCATIKPGEGFCRD